MVATSQGMSVRGRKNREKIKREVLPKKASAVLYIRRVYTNKLYYTLKTNKKLKGRQSMFAFMPVYNVVAAASFDYAFVCVYSIKYVNVHS